MATFITAGPDGSLWFTEPNGKIGRLTTSGEVKEFVFSDPYRRVASEAARRRGARLFRSPGFAL